MRAERYGRGMDAGRLVLAALANWHHHALPHVWGRQFFIVALTL